MVIDLLAGISWEPEIRGVLVAAVGTAVLMGSVWLILATNMGHRLATLVSAAGLMGWMAMMGLIWAFYGIGLRGDPPAWELVSIEGPASTIQAAGDDANARALSSISNVDITGQELVNRYCPGLVEATEEVRFLRETTLDPTLSLQYSLVGPNGEDRSYCNEEIGEQLAIDADLIDLNLRAANENILATSPLGADDPRFMTDAELDEAIATAIDDQTRKVSQLTLSTLAGQPRLIDAAEADGVIDVTGGWTLLSTSGAGEAISAADAFLVEVGPDGGGFDTSGEFFVLDAYRRGGKPTKDPDDGQLSRAWNEFRNTVMFWQPDLYTVVQVQATIDKEAVEGAPPPFSEVDPTAPVTTVIMKRDPGGIIPGLSALRTPAVLTFVASMIIFLMLCWMLHERDKTWEQKQADWDPSAAAPS